MRIKKLVCSVVASTAFIFLTYAYADNVVKDISISDAWVQAMPPTQTVSAAYLLITNKSSKEAVLVSASCDIAGATEIHQMSEKNGMMNMAMVPEVSIPALGKQEFKPGGFHIMLINLKKPVNKGDIVPITLHFKEGESIMVNADVRDI